MAFILGETKILNEEFFLSISYRELGADGIMGSQLPTPIGITESRTMQVTEKIVGR